MPPPDPAPGAAAAAPPPREAAAPPPTSEQRAFWEARAGIWEEFADDPTTSYTRRTRLVVELVRSHLDAGGRLLDVGCGVGLLTCELVRVGFDAYGADISPGMVACARRRARSLPGEGGERFRVCEEGTLPFAGPFDGVTAIGLFPYIRDHRAYLHLLAGRLRPRGLLVATCLNRRGLYTFYLLARHLVRFRRTPAWSCVARNLWRTGVWSGGNVPEGDAQQARSGPAFDRMLREEGFTLLERMDLYHLGGCWMDARPRRRSPPGAWLASRLGWTHIAVARRSGRR